MKKFLAVYIGHPSGMANWMKQDEAIRKEKEKKGMSAWKSWAEKNDKNLTDMGGPLGVTKRVDAQGVHDIRNALAAFTVVEAESHAAAAQLFLNHPHFTIFPGDGVEIMEILPVPNL